MINKKKTRAYLWKQTPIFMYEYWRPQFHLDSISITFDLNLKNPCDSNALT